MSSKNHSYDQVVYLLQGGGALGAYQVGVCEVLLQNGFAPDWVVGTSIGAINASLIAGNKPQDRAEKMKGFWNSITLPLFPEMMTKNHHWLRSWQNYSSAVCTALFGQDNFFLPRIINPLLTINAAPDKLSFYDTRIMRDTLERFIDFDLINRKETRLSLGAVSLGEGEQVEFDNHRQEISPDHIMASCALPPAFPAIEIDGQYYWDGGVVSNTPLQMILKEKVPQKLLCFMVNLFSHSAELPKNMMDVFKRKKDLGFSSRHHEVLRYLCELHTYQHLIYQLNEKVNQSSNGNDELCKTIKKIGNIGHPTACNIVRFHYHDLPSDSWCKDFEFSRQSQEEHHRIGHEDAMCAMNNRGWLKPIVDDTGVIIHDYPYGECV